MARTYRPTAFMDGLPLHWLEPLARDYQAQGHRVETGPMEDRSDQGWIRVYQLKREVLWAHINDTLGKPGEQETRSPQTLKHYAPKGPPQRGRKRYRVPGSWVRRQKLMGRPSLPLPGSEAARLREQRLREQREEQEAELESAVEAEERRYLRPDTDD